MGSSLGPTPNKRELLKVTGCGIAIFAGIALRRFLLREASLKFMTEQIKRAGGSILDNYTKAQSLP